MQHQLVKHGENYAVLIDPKMLESLHADSETRFDVQTSNGSLVLTPIPRGKDHDDFEAALTDTNRQFPDALRKLAE